MKIKFDKNPILLLEDNSFDVILLKETLNELGTKNELVVAGNGEEGLNYLNSGKDLPGLILCDINMPKMSGIEFLVTIKKHKTYKYIPLVILSSSGNEQDREKSFGNGAAGYMTKPIDHSKFIKMIETILNYWGFSEWYHIPNL